MSITTHRLWRRLRSYVKVERYNKDGSAITPRLRIEFRNLPRRLLQAALQMTMPCISCGAPIHPVRRRQGPIHRGVVARSGIYYAPTCPLHENISCSRKKEVRDEYERFRRRVP